MALVKQDGKLLIQGGALASGAGCCCGECPEGETKCGDACCPEGQECVDGECVEEGECPEGETKCGDACCPEGQACVDGECVGGGGRCCCCADFLAGCDPSMGMGQLTREDALFQGQELLAILEFYGVTPCKELDAIEIPGNEFGSGGWCGIVGFPYCVETDGAEEDCDCTSVYSNGELISFTPGEPCDSIGDYYLSLCNNENPLP